MPARRVHTIRKSFAQLARHEHVAGLVFYRRLFERAPELKPMFKGDIELQAKKLLEMLGVLIAMLERPHGLELELKAMGARHAGYGVKDEHYAVVGQALLDMLGETLDGDFTPDVREAWTWLYGAVESTMRAGAKELTEEELRSMREKR
ncbi:MAG: globin domain-containing protein [Prosthecobacter sp.]